MATQIQSFMVCINTPATVHLRIFLTASWRFNTSSLTMKLSSILVLSCLVVPFCAVSSLAVVRDSRKAENEAVLLKPLKISFHALEDDDYFAEDVHDSFIDALKTFGIVSITNVPGLKAMKEGTLSWDLHHCAKESEAAKAHQFPDGTVRHTLATHTLTGGYQHKFDHKTDSPSCKTFSAASDTFRKAVNGVTDAFAARLSSILKIQDKATPLLSTEAHYPFYTFADVVDNGEHLEHFHSYQHVVSQARKRQDTIDLHIDQGLFLVFTPGRMVNRNGDSALTTGFFIELQDGSLAVVDFDNEDDLVILLGDGVNQYVNPRLATGETLRAAPHALALPEHSDDKARVWYGRMVLPPATAIHPEHGRTFEDLRTALVEASITSDGNRDPKNKKEELSIGCSSSMVARQLESVSCQGDTMMCWHRCMNLTEAGVSEDSCAESGLSVRCINPRGQLWDNTHGDFFPGCASNDTKVATPYPPLPNAPRDDSECTDAAFAEFVKSTTTGYENSFDLGKGGVFMWTATNGQVDGRLAYNGLFGWLAFGFANVGGDKNGMHGANILMAIPGGNYSAVTGFDLSINASVQEYEISDNSQQSSFRFWDTSSDEIVAARHGGHEMVSSIEETDCFTSFSFSTEAINGVSFNVNGVDELIWGANANDTFAGYHSSRGRFSIDWSTSEAKLYVAPITSAPASASTSTSSAIKSVVSSLVLVMISVVAGMTFVW